MKLARQWITNYELSSLSRILHFVWYPINKEERARKLVLFPPENKKINTAAVVLEESRCLCSDDVFKVQTGN